MLTRAPGFRGHVRVNDCVGKIGAGARKRSCQHGSGGRCIAIQVRVKNRELPLWALRDVRPRRPRNARDGQLLRPTRARVSRVARPRLRLPGFPELLEQAGPVLVPSSPEPSLHLSFRVSRLLAETRYRSLRAQAETDLCQESHGECETCTFFFIASVVYLCWVFGYFAVVNLQCWVMSGLDPCCLFYPKQRSQRRCHYPAIRKKRCTVTSLREAI